MTAVLCRTFLKEYSSRKHECYLDTNKRVLVAAPTNKAISVLATRFLLATNSYMGLNVVLIGVEDALFPEDGGDDDDQLRKTLRNIFVYTWLEEILCDLNTLQLMKDSMPSLAEVEEILQCAIFIVQKVERSLPRLSEKYGCLRYGRSWLHSLECIYMELLEEEVDQCKILFSVQGVHECFDKFFDSLKEMNSRESIITELLNTANIIFCTLTSSGVSQMKWTRNICGKLICLCYSRNSYRAISHQASII